MVALTTGPVHTHTTDDSAPRPASIQDIRQEQPSATDSTSSLNVWDKMDTHPDQVVNGEGGATVGAPTRASGAPQDTGVPFDGAPDNPWCHPAQEHTEQASPESHQQATQIPLQTQAPTTETNPFKRKPVRETSPSTAQEATWGETGPSEATQPDSTPPTDTLLRLTLGDGEADPNPWGQATDEQKPRAVPPPLPSLHSQDNVWASCEEAPTAPSIDHGAESSTRAQLQPAGESPAWDQQVRLDTGSPWVQQNPVEEHEYCQEFQGWNEADSTNQGKGPVVRSAPAVGDDWNIVDHEADVEPWAELEADSPKGKQTAVASNEVPRATQAEQSPAAQADRNNKCETYQIKNINWVDATASNKPRRSPILMQNVNGPCPLVALVNVLSLTTPAELTNKVLVETLRSREQISLNLLLEAVFDELMSPRRHKPDVPLPDVSELYAFLKGLHRGMNVNPRYVPTAEAVEALKRTCLIDIQPSEHGLLVPGTFEETRDMTLYAAFSVPLIHGWLPAPLDPVHESLARQAASYDDVQSLLFREEELEDKLTADEGLSEHEQQLYQDIMTMKSFLECSATQLTPWGLAVITKTLKPGNFAILFRNDHFATLYRHPRTEQVLTLVTDAGYFSHDEIVWETLVDVKGEKAEFLSGDFQLVGGAQQQEQGNGLTGSSWYDAGEASSTIGPIRAQGGLEGGNGADRKTAMPSQHEQEDRDLALALQLQEEEEQQHRAEKERRQRESQLSERFIEQQGRDRGSSGGGSGSGRGGLTQVTVPARASSSNVSGQSVQQVRSLVPPASTTQLPPRTSRGPGREDEEAPPTYEQASKASPYVPPAGHASHAQSSQAGVTGRRRMTAGNAGAGHITVLRRSGGPVAANGVAVVPVKEKKECVMM